MINKWSGGIESSILKRAVANVAEEMLDLCQLQSSK
jgi:hypothetical protein